MTGMQNTSHSNAAQRVQSQRTSGSSKSPQHPHHAYGSPVDGDIGALLQRTFGNQKLGAAARQASGNTSSHAQPNTIQRAIERRRGANQIVNRVLPSKPTIQRYSLDEATIHINTHHRGIREWFFRVCVPAMRTIANRSGETLDDYLAAIPDERAFMAQVRALQTPDRDERSILERAAGRFMSNRIVDSEQYDNMKRVTGTNILVDPQQVQNADLTQFVQDYKAGTLVWYRGMSISHFAYGEMQESGVLGSEGTADNPTFSMGNANPTRWLPGVNIRDTADGIAHTLGRDDAALRAATQNEDLPIGVTLSYPVAPPTPIAFLNSGEQVLRGPLENVQVYRVILLGPGGYTYKNAASVRDLPPVAPYNAAVGAQAFNDWLPLARNWVQTH